jgi:uroporphyrin-III C-methyltransferase/precorrin-2 dehydrogenase/sirohydrochlorin ferrochelatase
VNPLANLPVFLKLAGRKAVLAGAGEPAAWKAELLAAAGAELCVFAANPSPRLAAALMRAAVKPIRRDWEEADFEGALIAVLQADDDDEAARFRSAARRAGALVNVIDRPAFCDFSFGSIVERSPLVIGVSTDGAAPVFGQAIRSRIETLFPDSLRGWAQAAREWRGRLSGFDIGRRRAIWLAFAARALGSLDRAPTEADFEALTTEVRTGRLVVVGVGPGDPSLVTLRAARALQAADFVVEDGRIDPGVRDLGRREAELETRAEGADEAMIARALERVARGETVIALVPGEGRATTWEVAAAEAGQPCEIVPGVAT